MGSQRRRTIVMIFVLGMFAFGCAAGVWVSSRLLTADMQDLRARTSHTGAEPLTAQTAGDPDDDPRAFGEPSVVPASIPVVAVRQPFLSPPAGDASSAAVFRRGLMAGLGFALVGAVLLGAGVIVLGARSSREAPDFSTSALLPKPVSAGARETAQASGAQNPQMAVLLQSMAAIEESSRHISGLVKTLDALAHQTNLAVLGAAVEAAAAADPVRSREHLHPATLPADIRSARNVAGRRG